MKAQQFWYCSGLIAVTALKWRCSADADIRACLASLST